MNSILEANETVVEELTLLVFLDLSRLNLAELCEHALKLGIIGALGELADEKIVLDHSG